MDLDSPPKPHILKALASFTSDADDRALLLLLSAAGAAGNGNGKVSVLLGYVYIYIHSSIHPCSQPLVNIYTDRHHRRVPGLGAVGGPAAPVVG